MANSKVKTDKTEFLRRLFIVQGWIVEGVQSSLIIRQILNHKWCTSQRQAERYLQQARDLWTEMPEMKLEQKRALKVVELQQIKRNMSDEFKKTPGGVRALMAVEKEIILLEGLRMPSKISLTDTDGNDVQMPIPQINIYSDGPPLARSEDDIN